MSFNFKNPYDNKSTPAKKTFVAKSSPKSPNKTSKSKPFQIIVELGEDSSGAAICIVAVGHRNPEKTLELAEHLAHHDATFYKSTNDKNTAVKHFVDANKTTITGNQITPIYSGEYNRIRKELTPVGLKMAALNINKYIAFRLLSPAQKKEFLERVCIFAQQLTGSQPVQDTSLFLPSDWNRDGATKSVNITITDKAAFVNGNGVDHLKYELCDLVDEIQGDTVQDLDSNGPTYI